VLAADVNFTILESKVVESGWRNNYKCVFQQGVILTIFPLKYPWALGVKYDQEATDIYFCNGHKFPPEIPVDCSLLLSLPVHDFFPDFQSIANIPAFEWNY
jgi:hypothetical protein